MEIDFIRDVPEGMPDEVLASIQNLRDEHRRANARVSELKQLYWLSPDQQVELARLKKLKLRLADELHALGVRNPL